MQLSLSQAKTVTSPSHFHEIWSCHLQRLTGNVRESLCSLIWAILGQLVETSTCEAVSYPKIRCQSFLSESRFLQPDVEKTPIYQTKISTCQMSQERSFLNFRPFTLDHLLSTHWWLRKLQILNKTKLRLPVLINTLKFHFSMWNKSSQRKVFLENL